MILYRDVRLFYLIAVVPCLTYILSICESLKIAISTRQELIALIRLRVAYPHTILPLWKLLACSKSDKLYPHLLQPVGVLNMYSHSCNARKVILPPLHCPTDLRYANRSQVSTQHRDFFHSQGRTIDTNTLV